VINIAVFASGSGTNFQAIADYFSGHEEIAVKLLLCNKPEALVLERARRLGIATHVFTRQELEETTQVVEVLERHDIHFIALAGFLLKIPENILKGWPGAIVNIHPALLPKYGGKGMYGLRVHQSVIESGDNFSGITIHMINDEYDKGSIVSQHTCLVEAGDTPEALASRIHELEHHWYPRIIEKLLIGDE
jgi:phosphoribosylglycinamide formyltransferase 1